VYAGVLWYPIERAREVLHAWRNLTVSDVPDEMTTVGRLLNLPPIEEIPEPVRGKSFVVVEAIHTGDPGEADGLLAPLRSLGPINDTIAPISMPELSHLHMDPEEPVPGLGDGMMLDRFDGAAVDAFIEVAGVSSRFPLLSIEIRHLEGELGRARPENGALASIEASYAMFAVGMTPVPELKAPTAAQLEAVKTTLAPWAARHMYLNFAETRRQSAQFWNEQAYHRLRRIKSAVDPADVIRSNHPIQPAYQRHASSRGCDRFAVAAASHAG
jgi:Berberine and berberine like